MALEIKVNFANPSLKTGLGDTRKDQDPKDDVREQARALAERHGEHADDYVRARIEASETAGEAADAAEWRKVLDALCDSEESD